LLQKLGEQQIIGGKQISDLEGRTQSNASSIQKLTAEKDTVQWQLDPVKGELDRAAQTATEASARMTELEKKASAFDADTAKLQTALDEATA